MSENILTSLNWLDVLTIFVIIAILYRGAVQGFVVELFKICGAFLATVIALHYYGRAAEALYQTSALPIKWGETISFILIVILVILVFKLVREGWLLILKVEAKGAFSQWGGGFVAFFRSFLMCGLLFFMIALPDIKTINAFSKSSLTGHYFRDLSPTVYKASFDGVIQKFFPDEVFNEKALKIFEKEPALQKK